MESFWKDVKYGARALGKNPGFTAVIVLTLGLGIGANTAIFSVVNSLLLRPLPVRDAHELVVLGVTHEGNEEPHPVAYLDYLDYRAQSDVFRDLTGYSIAFAGLAADGRAERVTLTLAAPNYFQMLGVGAALGRVWGPEEGIQRGADPLLVLGQGYWQRRFGGDPGVVGKAVSLNGRPFTIIGVVPEEFLGTYTLVEFDAYAPLSMAAVLNPREEDFFTRRDEHQFRVLGRLKPGVTRAQAQASLDVVARRLEAQYPETNKTVRVHVFPENLARPEPGAARQNPLAAGVFLLLAGMVLLVACVNVAALLLVRATVRQKELAIRAALGAGPARLLRQMLTESLLLAAAGGAAGALLGAWASRMLAAVRLPGDLPFRFDFGFDWRVFAYVAAIAVATGIAAGLLPAWRASRTDINDTLREGGRAQAAGAGRHRARNALVVAQVAGSVVLLVAAGLFVRSLTRAQTVDLGFNPRGVVNLTMDVAQQGYEESRGRAFYAELERRARALPGVEAASLAYSVPLGYYSLGEYIEAEGQGLAPDERRPAAGYNLAGTDYFRVMQVPLVSGRAFTAEDTATSRRVAVVNQFMARRLWPDQDAIGRRFRMTGQEGWIEVVGVSRDGKYNWLFQDPGMYFFLPIEQHYRAVRALQLRTTLPPETLIPAAQQLVRLLDPGLAPYDVMTMQEALGGGNGFFLVRMGAVFAAALGGLGLLLAVVGVYGVVSFAASRRTHEIGIRMALGAGRGDILRLILGQGMRLVIAGALVGLAAALGLARFIANMLFGIPAHDPVTFGGVALLLAAVALAACWIPARRATRVDPVIALRHE